MNFIGRLVLSAGFGWWLQSCGFTLDNPMFWIGFVLFQVYGLVCLMED